MAIAKSKVKTPVGMMTSHYWPIKSEPENSHPVYDAAIDMGAAVKGYISVTTASASIPGDDIAQEDTDEQDGQGLSAAQGPDGVEGNDVGNAQLHAGDGEGQGDLSLNEKENHENRQKNGHGC